MKYPFLNFFPPTRRISSSAILRAFSILSLCAGAILSGCENNTTPKPPPQTPLNVFLSPSNATISSGASIPLTATITGWTTDSTVSWKIITSAAGESQLGTLSPSGTSANYAAPTITGTTTLSVTIEVYSNQDTAITATCIITVQPQTGGGIHARISISPLSITLAPGQSQQFQATVTGSTNTNVQWKILSGVGTLVNGLYTTPDTLSPPTINTVIEAISLADTTAVAQAEVIDQIPSPCFRTVVWPILLSHCTVQGCHNPIDRTHGLDFSSYAGVMATVIPGDTTNSLLHQRLNHFATSPDSQVRAINIWILTGAQYTTCPPDMADCDTSNVSFAAFIAPTIATNCLGCHSQRFASECDNLDLSTYASIDSVAMSGALVNVLQWQNGYPQMPQWGPQLDQCVINKFTAWVNQGAKNN